MRFKDGTARLTTILLEESTVRSRTLSATCAGRKQILCPQFHPRWLHISWRQQFITISELSCL